MIVTVIIVLEPRWLPQVCGNFQEHQEGWKIHCNLVSERNKSHLFLNCYSGVCENKLLESVCPENTQNCELLPYLYYQVVTVCRVLSPHNLPSLWISGSLDL